MDFFAMIDGTVMRCVLTTDRPLKDAVLCCSGIGPMSCVSGGETVEVLGSQIEIALPALAPGQDHEVVLQYDGRTPANRAWLPQAPYLRHQGEVIHLPTGPLGARHPLPRPAPVDGLRLIPQPTHWDADGRTVQTPGFICTDATFQTVSHLAQRNGLAGFLDPDGLPVTVESAKMAKDAYALTITPDAITLTAGDDGGRLYGAITLFTLLHTHEGDLPCGVLQDAPRFAWRGQHLDCARHYFKPSSIIQLMDLMALLKMNRFHWHFADDEAFRLEIDSLPELWQKTTRSGDAQLLPGFFGEGPESGGSYSKAEAQALIAHGHSLNIEILPEIEAPAHALCITRVYPDVLDPQDNGAEASVQGYRRNALNPAMPRTWEVLDAMVTEVGALFPFGHLHLGCDELAVDTWMSSPAARHLMEAEGLADTDDLQGWTMAKLAGIVVANGQRPAAWEEAAKGSNGGIGHDAILFSWTGQGPGVEAAKAGYDVVMTPAQHAYLDMAATSDPDDWGANWAATVSLADTINWNPIPTELGEAADHVIGVQGTFWGEFTTEDSQLWPMLLPRILGIAAVGWQTDMTLDGDSLSAIAGHYAPIMRAFGA